MANPLEQLISTLSPEKRAVLAEMLRPAPEPIAIVGMSCRFPGESRSPEAFWELLRKGGDAIVDVPSDRWDSDAFYDPDPTTPGKMYTRWGGFLREIGRLDARFFGISPSEALRLDPQQQILLEVAWEALERTGHSLDDLSQRQTGVFIGITNGEYSRLQTHHTGAIACSNDPFFMTGSSLSMAAGRIAYLFDLQGPCLVVDTACSSSLVATHLACQSLRNKECDLALVGGVSLIMLPDIVVSFCKMGMLSRSGRCKTFDAAADGFALGEGCSVVVLKRLSDALKDGTPIIALIRGSAVNEDGRSTSPTAPNGLAQQAVIRKALANAEIKPEQVSYVEAHGSATALGDPIEMEAISAVLGAGRTPSQRLMVGAVKTNVGHMIAAAGMAGLIKTSLALQQKEIPPHLNLRDRNPSIPWDEHPIDVPTKLTPWTVDRGPRIAGVSSFGWSGTNAHVVLEEAPSLPPSGPSRSWHLLTLSAKTASALDAMTANMANYLHQHPEGCLADVAYTLLIGRQRFAHRRALVCRDPQEASTALIRLVGSPTLAVSAAAPPVAWMFSGVGDHYSGMAQELYANEPVFRDAIDRCCTFLSTQMPNDVRAVLYPAGVASPTTAADTTGTIDLRALIGRDGMRNANESPLHATALAQPAVFVVEYALAQMLESWGIRPQAMIGYSLGEYVAACIAGVLTLEDALRLVAKRATLIQALPRGAMLAVSCDEATIQSYLTSDVCLAALNSPNMCVLSGPPDAITAVAAALTAREIASRPLETTHAFHSTMLAPIAESVTALVRSVTLNPPRIPYLSNVTGTWITNEQAMDPTYWARHMCQTVRFADGVGELLREESQILVEMGAGQSLCSFVKQHPACTRERLPSIVPTLRAAHEQHSDIAYLLGAIGKLWQLGVQVQGRAWYANEQRYRLALPTYPFEHQDFWLASSSPAAPRPAETPDRRADIAEWFSTLSWQRATPPALAHVEATLVPHRTWLLLVDACGVGAQIANWLAAHNQTIVLVTPGAHFSKHDTHTYTLRPSSRADYEALLRDLQTHHLLPQEIIHLWSVTPTAPDDANDDAMALLLDQGFYSLLALTQALGDQGGEACRISIVSNDMQDVSGTETLCPIKATVIGPCKIIPQEYPNLSTRAIDIALPTPGDVSSILPLLMRELVAGHDSIVALRSAYRWLPTFESIAMPPAHTAPRLRKGGVYLITGGLGGIGLILAEYLVGTLHANVSLVGRSALPPRDQWAQVQADATHPLAQRITHLQALEAQGGKVLVLQADVADVAQMRHAVAQTQAHFGALHGVLHTAGVPGVGIMQLKTPEAAAAVLAPKVQGTRALAQALADCQLDFLMLFSSVISILGGGPGQVDYCAANAFLDTYARRHRHQHGLTISVGWGEWQWDAWNAGLQGFSEETRTFLINNRRTYGIRSDEGVEAFRRVLAHDVPHIFVTTQPIAHMQEQSLLGAKLTLAPAPENQSRYPRPILGTTYIAPRNEIEKTIAALWERALSIEQIGIDDNFFDLGGNSLLGVDLIARIRRELHLDVLPAHVLYAAPTIGTLAAYLAQDQQPTVADDEFIDDRDEKRKKRLSYAQRRSQAEEMV